MYAWAESLFTIDIVLMVLANVLWYWIKVINSSHGRRTNVLWHLGDVRHFTQVIKAERDPQKLKKYRAILWTLRVCILAVVLVTVVGGVLVWTSETPLREAR
jgi:hypothetical protein